jgi:fatty-acyl-CoA synthase
MTIADWSLPGAIDAVTAAVYDRDMLVWTSVRRTYGEVQDRTRRLAAFFCQQGLGVRRERQALERWECGQSRVAILLSNCPEYVETMLAAWRARAVPYNVNHHYHPTEIAALLGQIGADAIVYHRRLAPLLAEVDPGRRLLVDVDDGSGVSPLPSSVEFEAAVTGRCGGKHPPTATPDDLYMVCTGGTTGRPKGVLWRQGDIYVAAMGGAEGATAETIAESAPRNAQAWFAAPPLMHAAAQWTVFAALHNGGTVVLHDDAVPFDPHTILETAARERVSLLTIVGDAYARPIVEELRARSYDLSALQQLATGGAMTSPAVKYELLELLPHVVLVDGYGSSETGGMAFGASTRGAPTQQFRGSTGAVVLSGDRSRFLEPGDDELGWTARIGRVPLGYLDDRDATEQTFPIVEGRRLAVPGDRATVADDGSIVLLGRDALVVNSGGEKIFVEEVEEVVRRHPGVFDAIVVGRPSDRFGEELVAIVELRPATTVDGADIRSFVAREISRFKSPRAVLVCDSIVRHPSGKADYRWARAAAINAVTVAE